MFRYLRNACLPLIAMVMPIPQSLAGDLPIHSQIFISPTVATAARREVAPICRVSLQATERNHTPIAKKPIGDRVAWVCTIDNTNVTCFVPTSGGIGDYCVCCNNGQCLDGTITDRS
jgi:hypothetical protein